MKAGLRHSFLRPDNPYRLFLFLGDTKHRARLHGHAGAGALHHDHAGDIGAWTSAASALAFANFLATADPFIGGDDAMLSQSRMRPAKASGEKPPNTTECTAPMRAQASMA